MGFHARVPDALSI
jgi:hypothetical protein